METENFTSQLVKLVMKRACGGALGSHSSRTRYGSAVGSISASGPIVPGSNPTSGLGGRGRCVDNTAGQGPPCGEDGSRVTRAALQVSEFSSRERRQHSA
ncbi:hypothetical protein scyTo_0015913 [Scyliorhinus torazame]|uniref:Uncharacterized protein n=1 Tax=Scyliorhinus torazame TaxID=75743 RepID=A0A401Q0R7_SCYTO|nr:hypothetical protein [Scyliorhinus torazame]